MFATTHSVSQDAPNYGAGIGTLEPTGNAYTGNTSSTDNDCDSGELSCFRVDDKGVFALVDGKEIKLCSPILIDAVTRDENGHNYGRALRWKDDDGRWHKWMMPVSSLAGEMASIFATLLNEGVHITSNRKDRELLGEYFQQSVEQRLTSVDTIGWKQLPGNTGKAFVLPSETISPPGKEAIVFQSRDVHRYQGMECGGSLEGWQVSIGRWSQGNSRLMFTICAALAGPLLGLVGEQGGGFHFMGITSGGKTTLLRAAASVMGSPKMIKNWRTTDNALESTAVAHNHLTLLLDEIGQLASDKASDVAYMLGNGQGKERANKGGGNRESSTWQLLFLSTGEITLTDHAADAGKFVKGGVEVRCLNIEADTGKYKVFENLHCAPDGGTFAQWIKDAAEEDYGQPLREFLRYLVDHLDQIQPELRERIDGFVRTYAAGMASEVRRAAKRFGLVAVAGELASKAGITGWSPGEATDAVKTCFESYLALRGSSGESDIDGAVKNVMAFIETHGTSRFQRLDVDAPYQPRIMNRAGFCRKTANGFEYYLMADVFKKEICRGTDYKRVAEELDKRGLLLRDDHTRWTKKVRLPDLGSKNVFAIVLPDAGEDGNIENTG